MGAGQGRARQGRGPPRCLGSAWGGEPEAEHTIISIYYIILTVSAQMSQDHMATAFHFLISKRGATGGAFFFLTCSRFVIGGPRVGGGGGERERERERWVSELVRPRASVGGKEGDGRPTRPLSSLLFARRRGPEQRGDGPSAPRIPVTLGAQGLSFSHTHIQTLTCSPSAAGAAGAAGAASAMSTSLASSALMAVFGLGGGV